jgi:putative transposase
MRFYRRRLPHRDIPGTPVFVTWSLFGSLPAERGFRREHLSSGEAFAAWDGLLDTERSGARYLAQREIAEVIVGRIEKVNEDGLCELDAFVVMPNHVHVLWTPSISLAEVVRRVKGSSAIEANRILGRTGARFWQEEYFDRTVRDEQELRRVRAYIQWNPVKAGLVASPALYRWSSAFRGERG